MAEFVAAPATNDTIDVDTWGWDQSRDGDCYVREAEVIAPYASGTQTYIGRDAVFKNNIAHGHASHYDTSAIPLGSTIHKAKLSMKASATNAVGCTASFDVLDRTPHLDSRDSQIHTALFMYDAKDASDDTLTHGHFSLTNTTATRIQIHQDLRLGIGSVSQAWFASASAGEIDKHWWMIYRTLLNDEGDGSVRTDLYSAEGSLSNYQKGELLDTGIERPISEVPTGANTVMYMEPSAAITTVAFDVYISELVFTGIDGAGTGWLNVHWDSDFPSFQNSTFHAHEGYKLQGFGGAPSYVAPCWQGGGEIRDAESYGTTDTVELPTFTSGVVYEFGDSGYAGVDELPNFTDNIAAALDAREATSEWVGIRIGGWDEATNGSWRKIHSSRSATATQDSLFGVVLTIDYTEPVAPPPPGRSEYLLGSGVSSHTTVGTGASVFEVVGHGISITPVLGSGVATSPGLTGSGVSSMGVTANMTDDQDIVHIRGDDLKIPVTVTLDGSRTLAGTETWTWVLRRSVESAALISKSIGAGEITVDGVTNQPTIVITDTDFALVDFPVSSTDQTFVHELEMTGATGLVETVMRGVFTLRSDVAQ